MMYRSLAALSILLLSPAAFAAVDLVTTVALPGGSTNVYATGRYNITVANVGNVNASGVTLAIQLPPTHTSPQVYVLGTVGAFGPVIPGEATCTRTNTVINCTLGQVKRNRSKVMFVDLALPVSSTPLILSATAPAAPGEIVTGNNSGSATAALTYYNVVMSPSRPAINRHCTGTGLSAFFECELFPSSLSSHNTTFEGNPGATSGTINFEVAGYTGDWTVSGDSLVFHYFDDTAALVATFNGKGVGSSGGGLGGNCYEGLTTFPGSSYVSPYEVCLQ